MTQDDAESIAIGAVLVLVDDSAQLARFLETYGLGAESVATAAGEPGFAVAVLDFVLSQNDLLLKCAATIGVLPEAIGQARLRLWPAGDMVH